MNRIKPLLSVLFLFATHLAMAQLQIDHPIELTGNGADAKITGIQNVTNTQDAMSVQALQSGSFIYSVATGNSNNFNINISPAINAYQAGMVFNFISNQTITDSATLNVNGLGIVAIVKNATQKLSACDLINGQAVQVIYDGTNFQVLSPLSTAGGAPTAANAGPNQLNATGTITLAANTALSGTGVWSVDSGSGGTFSNTSSPTSTFSGVAGNAYVLTWTISTSLCGTSSSNVDVSFSSYEPGTQTFNYTGSEQTFTVPNGAISVTITAYGAGGGASNAVAGGLGAEMVGTFSVTPGQVLDVIVGQVGYSNNGGSGGGGGSGVVSAGVPLIVAGGGGGVDGGGYSGSNGITSNSGQAGQNGGTSGSGGSAGGSQDYDGTSSIAYGGNGINQGLDGSTGTNGYTSLPTTTANGTFGLGGGGGGVGASYCNCGGGGGGYSGGGAGGINGNGGGGGSYNSGTNQNDISGVQSGNGQVTISW